MELLFCIRTNIIKVPSCSSVTSSSFSPVPDPLLKYLSRSKGAVVISGKTQLSKKQNTTQSSKVLFAKGIVLSICPCCEG
jgi:hypothetical protein